MKPHKHAELIKAWADGAEIEQSCRNGVGEILWYPFKGTWSEYYEYRIKSEPKPDVHIYECPQYDSERKKWYFVDSKPSLMMTFDGETGELKSAEVLKG